jgi:hypothetical protein
MSKNFHRNKFKCLEHLARDPNLTARKAAEVYDCDRHTVELWAREAGIKLTWHLHGRVGFALQRKIAKRKRLISELARVNREIAELERRDPQEAWIKPKKKRNRGSYENPRPKRKAH